VYVLTAPPQVGLARELCDEQEGGASPIALTARAAALCALLRKLVSGGSVAC
jgi:hypothetical protein